MNQHYCKTGQRHDFSIRTPFGMVCANCEDSQQPPLKAPTIAYKPQKQSGISNERQLILKDFLERINPARKEAGYKPYTPARFGVKVAPLSTELLQYLYGVCKKAKNFTACFESEIKVKKDEKIT